MIPRCPEEPAAIDDDRYPLVRVLIAEDDPRVRNALRSFLSASTGFEVVGDAGTASTALELARERAPSVVLVDVFLPTARDGLDLLRTITGELRIPAVAMSIHGGFRSSTLTAGAYRFLDKDSAPEHMVAALRAAVAGEHRRPDRS
jgi:DNA-binding NarL/FixJ family response regulator